MVGLVIVSHSARLAEGVVELAREMGGDEVPIEAAGGLDDPEGAIGTDAMRVLAAIQRGGRGADDGALVLMDLGSAVLSAETALDFLAGGQRGRVLLCEAPLVEGAVAAAAAARAGAPLDGGGRGGPPRPGRQAGPPGRAGRRGGARRGRRGRRGRLAERHDDRGRTRTASTRGPPPRSCAPSRASMPRCAWRT